MKSPSPRRTTSQSSPMPVDDDEAYTSLREARLIPYFSHRLLITLHASRNEILISSVSRSYERAGRLNAKKTIVR
jgi:hypothetical protein